MNFLYGQETFASSHLTLKDPALVTVGPVNRMLVMLMLGSATLLTLSWNSIWCVIHAITEQISTVTLLKMLQRPLRAITWLSHNLLGR